MQTSALFSFSLSTSAPDVHEKRKSDSLLFVSKPPSAKSFCAGCQITSSTCACGNKLIIFKGEIEPSVLVLSVQLDVPAMPLTLCNHRLQEAVSLI